MNSHEHEILLIILGVMSTGVVALIGKIIFDWLKNRNIDENGNTHKAKTESMIARCLEIKLAER